LTPITLMYTGLSYGRGKSTGIQPTQETSRATSGSI
jgi:hypothetical protein